MSASKRCNNVRNPYLHNIITLAVFLYTFSRVIANITRSESIQNKTTEWSFLDFLKNFEPKTARSRIRNGRRSIKTNEEYINAMFEGIDATDALLSLDVAGIHPTPAKNESRRNLKNLMVVNNYYEDPFNYRRRLYELMKQAIYQARTEMPVWQNMRKEHKDHKLYKMGFLMSKTDNAVKIFSQFVFRSYKLCYLVSFHKITQMNFYEVLLLHERALSLWFNVQLLTDLIFKNDVSCRETEKHFRDYLLENWKYFD